MDESQKRAAGSLFHMLRAAARKENPDAERGSDRVAAAMLRRAGKDDLADEIEAKWSPSTNSRGSS